MPDASLMQRQFRQPAGPLGRVVGWVIARENRRMNRMAVEWLDVHAGDDVLEIGFGPGHGIELLVKRTAARSIVGIDPSPVMIEQAVARNREAVAAGQVQLVLGDVDAMPFADGQFSRVVAVSNFHVWPSRREGVAEIRRVLREDGMLVLCLRRAKKSPWPWTSPGVSLEQLHQDQKLLEEVGFRRVHLATRKLGRRIQCLLARK
jgi:ubiquinone/menaquinone biosynthesis C-methylase UbiE